MRRTATAAPADDVEAAEVSRIADVGLSFDPDPFNARGDARDAMLGVIRATVDWGKFNESQQRDINAQVNQTAEAIIAKLVRAIAAEGQTAVRAKVEQLTVKDGLKLQLTALHDHDTVVLLGDLVGKHVSLVAADADAFGHQRGDAPVQPDQPQLPVDQPGDDSDLVAAADPPSETNIGVVIRDGDELPEGTARVNLKTGLVQTLPTGGNAADDLDWADLREATPEELAAERDRLSDFDDGGDGSGDQPEDEAEAAQVAA